MIILFKEQLLISRYVTLIQYRGQMLTEVFVMLFQPYVFFEKILIPNIDLYEKINFPFKLNYLLTITVFVRIYAVIRAYLIHTEYCTPRSSRICRMYGTDADYKFAAKALFKHAPVSSTCIILIISFIAGSLAIGISEKALLRYLRSINYQVLPNMNFANIINSMWCVVATMTTTGYGDFYTRTFYGRAVTGLLAVWGVFCVSLMSVVLEKFFMLDSLEKRALLVMNKLIVRNRVVNNASDLIKNGIRIKCMRK